MGYSGGPGVGHKPMLCPHHHKPWRLDHRDRIPSCSCPSKPWEAKHIGLLCWWLVAELTSSREVVTASEGKLA